MTLTHKTLAWTIYSDVWYCASWARIVGSSPSLWKRTLFGCAWDVCMRRINKYASPFCRSLFQSPCRIQLLKSFECCRFKLGSPTDGVLFHQGCFDCIDHAFLDSEAWSTNNWSSTFERKCVCLFDLDGWERQHFVASILGLPSRVQRCVLVPSRQRIAFVALPKLIIKRYKIIPFWRRGMCCWKKTPASFIHSATPCLRSGTQQEQKDCLWRFRIMGMQWVIC